MIKKIVHRIKLRTWISLLLIAILLPIAVFTLFRPSDTSAEWFDEDWKFRKKILITKTVSDETNVYIAFDSTDVLDTSGSGKFQANCQDIRFTKQNGQLLPYHINSGCGTASTDIDVLFDSLPVGTHNIYFYYGNPSAPPADYGSAFPTEATNYTIGTPGSEEISPGPIAFWKFDEGVDNTCSNGTDDVCDSTSTGADGAKTGTAWQTEDMCVSGKCLFFDGTDDTVTVSDTVSGVKSVSFWVKIMSTSTTEQLLDLNGTDYITSVSGTVTAAGFGTETIYVDGIPATTLTANKWHHIAVTTSSSLSASAIKLGQISTNFGNVFLDEVKLYPYTRSATQIKVDYTGGAAVLGKSNQSGDFLSNGLVGYWKMDENTGTSAADASGNSNTMTLSATSWTAGKYGPAWLGDGTKWITRADDSDFDFSATEDFTLNVWAKSTSGTNPATNEFLIDKELASQGYGLYYTTNGHPVFGIDDDTDFDPPDDNVEYLTDTYDTNWHMVTAVKKGTSKIELYIDGELVVSDDSLTVTTTLDNSDLLSIGAQDGIDGPDEFNGSIDEVRIYRRALSTNEIRQLASWAPGPVGYWKMDEGTGTTTTYDSSRNAYNGTLTSITEDSWTVGKFGNALNLDGGADFIDVGTGPTDIRTISFWVYPETSTEYFVDLNGTDYVWVNGGTVTVAGFGTETIYVNGVASTTLAADTWSHVEVTTNSSFSAIDLDIGRIEGVGYLEGKIDEVKVYNYTRTSQQIVEDMNAGHPAPGSPIGSPIGHWKLDDMNGTTAQDSSINNLDLTLVNTPTWTTTSHINSGLTFTAASSEYGYIADNNTLSITSDLTLSAWIKPSANTATTFYTIAGKWDGTNESYLLTQYGDELRFYVDSSSYYTETTAANLQTGTWYYVAGVYSASAQTLKIYLNGQLMSSSAVTPPTSIGDDAGRFHIGAAHSSTSASGFFDGIIDEVKLFNSTLTEDQIKLDYNAGAAVNFSTGQVEAEDLADGAFVPNGYWPLDENTGTSTTYDKSSNGRNGTLTSITESSWIPGKYGSALILDGSADFVDVGIGPSDVNSVSFWVYPETTTEYFVDLNGTDYIYASSGTVTVAGMGTEIIYVNGVQTSTISANQWSHIAVTSATSVSASDLDIGRIEGVGLLEGKIDEVKLFADQLTQAQIAYDYNRGRPIAWYKFDECQGTTVYDSSGNGINGTIVPGSGDNTSAGTCSSGTASQMWNDGTTGKYNSSLGFDNDDDYVTVSSHGFPTGDFSVAMWFYSNGTNDTLLNIGNSVFGNELSLRRTSLTSIEVQTNHSVRINGSTALSNATWYHYALTRSGSTLTAYLNGNFDGTGTDGTAFDFGSCPITIGADRSDGSTSCSAAPSNPFAGLIDDVRVYNYALSATQVKNVMNNDAAVRYGPATGSP